MQEGMTIGRLAKAAGVNVETVRYYQRRGLIGEPGKPPGGQRRYSVGVLHQIAFIRRAQQLGFSLEEVRSLLRLAAGRKPRQTRELAERKYEELSGRVAQLNAMIQQLGELIEASRELRGRGADPIIAKLNENER